MFPKPYYFKKSKIRVFVLGADPSTDSKIEFEYVFGINSGDRRYFAGIERNLLAIGLSIENIYVQNLIQDYLPSETSKNKEWEKYAEKWLPITQKEFNKIDPSKEIPVLVTAERIMRFLYSEVPKAKEIYSGSIEVPFLNNKLNRPLIALYRHYNYSLTRIENGMYASRLKEIFNNH
jgi:hypothetical protein